MMHKFVRVCAGLMLLVLSVGIFTMLLIALHAIAGPFLRF